MVGSPIMRAALLGGRTAFSPAALGSRLFGWWDAEDAGSLTLSGSQVAAWVNKAGGQSMAQAIGGSRPVYQASGFGGRPAVYFDGIDDTLEIESVFLPSGAAVSEIYILAQTPTGAEDAAAARSLLSYGGGFGAQRNIQRIVASGVARVRAVVGIGGSNTTLTLETAVYEGRKIAEVIIGADTTTVSLDELSASAAVVPATGGVGALRTRIGAGSNTVPINFWLGAVSSIVVTGALSPGERAALKTFLGRRL